MYLFRHSCYPKSALLLATCILFTYMCVAQQHQSFRLTGKLESKRIKTVTLSYHNADGELITSTDTLSNGAFTFSGFINEPSAASLSCDMASNNMSDVNYVSTFFIEPGKMKIDIKEGHFKSLKLSGSSTQKEYASLEASKAAVYQQMAPLQTQLAILNDTFGKVINRKDTARINETMKARLSVLSQLKRYNLSLAGIDIAFATQHPDSYLSAYLLCQALDMHYTTADTIKSYFRQLLPYIQESYYGRKIKNLLGLTEVLPAGTTLPDIAGTDASGTKTFVNSIIGQQYTLLIFWASWCAPCRKNMPEYKKMYAEYQPQGLKVIAITRDKVKDDWLKAIQQEHIKNWQHFRPDIDSKLDELYGITTIPAYILLKNNKVIAIYGGMNSHHLGLQDVNNQLQKLFKAESKP